jgi:hypothetical protein
LAGGGGLEEGRGHQDGGHEHRHHGATGRHQAS